MKNSEFDQLLKTALSPTDEPDDELNQSLKKQIKEIDYMKLISRKRMAVALTAVAITLVMSVTAFAAWQLLTPKDVALHFGDSKLAQAFEEKNAVVINKTVVSGGYNITLLGITSGKGLSDLKSSDENINPDRTYAVVSIAKEDGSKMPDVQDEDYGKVPFFISPLIKGQKPWQVNIASMNGGYSACVIDGVMYRLIECDGIEMFADRGLYMCVSSSTFYDIKAFSYNEKTGEVTINKNYNGVAALFDLPLDIKKADHKKADKYLSELLGETADDSANQNPKTVSPAPSTKTKPGKAGNKEPKKGDLTEDLLTTMDKSSKANEKLWKKELESAVVIPESVKVLTCDKDGFLNYKYGNSAYRVNLKYLFRQGETGIKTVCMNGSDEIITITQIMKDSHGVIRGRTLKVK